MKRISLYPNPQRDPQFLRSARVAALLKESGAEVLLPVEYADAFPFSEITAVSEAALFEESDLLITLGGDGTILSVAERAAKAQLPVFGINLGHVGFLTSLEAGDLEAVRDAVNGKLYESSRMLLSCRVGEKEYTALNEFVITPERGLHMLEAELWVGESQLCRYRADALIFHTPTGSTGHAFSAGGAVTDADLDCIGVKAASSYLLINSHPMIFSPETQFSLKKITTGAGSSLLCADGREVELLGADAEISIFRSPYRLRLVGLKPHSNMEAYFRKF